MASSFTTALNKGLATVRAVAGSVVTYERGAIRVGVTAVSGATEYSAELGDVVVDRFISRDFMISAADLAAAFSKRGEVFDEPRRGDRIVDDDLATTFEIFPPTGGTVFEFADPDHSEYRIHAKKVA